MKKVIITGATGAIGIALIKYALKENLEVLAICHRGSKRINRLPNDAKVHILELSVDEYEEFVENGNDIACYGKYDCFFHLAWQGTTGLARNDMSLQLENIRYTLDAVELAAAFGCECFVGAGSQAEYGRVEGKISSKTATFPENGYGIAKLCAGQMSRIKCEQLGIKHIWTRILSVYGPCDGENSLIMSAVNGFMKKQKTEFTEGMQKWDYLYSEDAARIMYGLVKYGKSGNTYCVGSGKIQLLKDYIRQVYIAVNDYDISDKDMGIGCRPYMDKQVMYLQADTSEWPIELQQEFEKFPMRSFEKGIKEVIEWKKSVEKEE